MNVFLRNGLLTALAALTFGLAACTSAEELVEDGEKLEQEGRYLDAVRKYIAAYDKDPDIIALEDRVTELGNRVTADLFAEAKALYDDGSVLEAAEVLLERDALVRKAAEAGLSFDQPSSYEERSRIIFGAAVKIKIERAEASFEAGLFAEADAGYRDLLDRFSLDNLEHSRVQAGRYGVLTAWASELVRAGSYRESIRRADEALSVANSNGLPPAAAIAVREQALELGTIYAAATPVRGRERALDNMTSWFLDELNDGLELDRWIHPPEFIAMAHGALVRQRLRRMRSGRYMLNVHDAHRLASQLDADFVVASEIERFDWSETNIKEKSKLAKTVSGNQVTYIEISGRIEYTVVTHIMIVSHSGEVIYDHDIEDRRSSKFKRAEFDGDVEDLDVSRETRRLFQDRHYDNIRSEIEQELARHLAESIAERVYAQLGREIR